jgi:hypothetical protein
MRRRHVAVAATAAFLSSVILAPVPAAVAGTGLNRFNWGGAGITLSQTSFRYSNMAGFWQAVLNSNGCPVAVDGNYGPVTTWHTAAFQNGLFGWNNGGVMTPTMLDAVQSAQSVYGPRFNPIGLPDGFGTQGYYYYGGFGSDETRVGWNPFASQWVFSQYPRSNPGAYAHATPTRTIGSVAACS